MNADKPSKHHARGSDPTTPDPGIVIRFPRYAGSLLCDALDCYYKQQSSALAKLANSATRDGVTDQREEAMQAIRDRMQDIEMLSRALERGLNKNIRVRNG